MSKGNRKRTNKVSAVNSTSVNVETTETKVEQQKIEQPKSECIVNPMQQFLSKFPVKGMHQEIANLMKETIDLNNRFQTNVKHLVTEQENDTRTSLFLNDLKTGKVKPPIMVKKNDNLMIPIYDFKKYIDDQKMLLTKKKEMLLIAEGQIGQWYNQYVDALVRLKFSIDQLLENHPDKDIIKGIEGHRISRKFDQAEQKSFIEGFTKDVKDLTDADKKMIAEAAKENAKKKY